MQPACFAGAHALQLCEALHGDATAGGVAARRASIGLAEAGDCGVEYSRTGCDRQAKLFFNENGRELSCVRSVAAALGAAAPSSEAKPRMGGTALRPLQPDGDAPPAGTGVGAPADGLGEMAAPA